MNKSDSITELSKALSEFQKAVKQPLKDADNPFFKSKYVPLESVVEAITEIAPDHGLSFTQWPSNDDNGRVGVATLLLHESGEYIEFDPVFMNADKNTPQGAGALITYLKRYSLSAVFGITSDKDDDANEASGNNQTKQAPKQASQTDVGNLNKEIASFSTLMKDRGTEVTPDQVKQQLSITDPTQLSQAEINQAIQKIKQWSK